VTDSFFTAPDGDGEPTLWRLPADRRDEPAAILRRCDLATEERETGWAVIAAGADLAPSFTAARAAARPQTPLPSPTRATDGETDPASSTASTQNGTTTRASDVPAGQGPHLEAAALVLHDAIDGDYLLGASFIGEGDVAIRDARVSEVVWWAVRALDAAGMLTLGCTDPDRSEDHCCGDDR
jgi:hypothetical protein